MRICTWAGMALCLVLLAGCRQEMAQQPQHAPLTGSDFFADGRSSRDLVPGTVPRGQEPLEAAYCRQRLFHWLAGLRRGEDDTAVQAQLTPEQRENLRALGYVQ